MAKVLLLNSNEKPLRITSWKRALVLLIKGKAQCAEHISSIEDFIEVENQYIPRIIKLNYNVAVPDKELPFCRENIFIRDNYTCQYCGRKFPVLWYVKITVKFLLHNRLFLWIFPPFRFLTEMRI